jgi:hypothetical protein
MSRNLLLQKRQLLSLLTAASNAALDSAAAISGSGSYCCSAFHCLLLLRLDSLLLPIAHGPGIPIVDGNFTTSAFILAVTLADAITAAKTETAGQIADVESRLTDAIAAAEAMGLSRDQAITAAVDSVAAELGTTRADLLTQLGTTEAALRTEFATGISGLEAQTKAQYDSLSAAQKATADALVAQGTTLADAIASAQQQTAGQIADVETRLTDAIAAADTDAGLD